MRPKGGDRILKVFSFPLFGTLLYLISFDPLSSENRWIRALSVVDVCVEWTSAHEKQPLKIENPYLIW